MLRLNTMCDAERLVPDAHIYDAGRPGVLIIIGGRPDDLENIEDWRPVGTRILCYPTHEARLQNLRDQVMDLGRRIDAAEARR